VVQFLYCCPFATPVTFVHVGKGDARFVNDEEYGRWVTPTLEDEGIAELRGFGVSAGGTGGVHASHLSGRPIGSQRTAAGRVSAPSQQTICP
jgi:hypothetical protein